MSVPVSPIDASSNHLLSMLTTETYRQLTSRLQLVRTEFKQVIFQRDQLIEYAYFPVTSGFSVLPILRNGTAVEIGTIGNEGFAGIDLLLGSDLAMDTMVC